MDVGIRHLRTKTDLQFLWWWSCFLFLFSGVIVFVVVWVVVVDMVFVVAAVVVVMVVIGCYCCCGFCIGCCGFHPMKYENVQSIICVRLELVSGYQNLLEENFRTIFYVLTKLLLLFLNYGTSSSSSEICCSVVL